MDAPQGSISKAIEDFMNPIPEDPVVNFGVKALPVVGALAGITSMLQGMGVPSTPANTHPNYGKTLEDNGGIGDLFVDKMQTAAPEIIGYDLAKVYSSDQADPFIKKTPIYAKPKAQPTPTAYGWAAPKSNGGQY
jgi:hypothetical protein